MKVGSLVGVLPQYRESIHPSIMPFVRWLPNPTSTYTIKEVGQCNCCDEGLAILEEGSIGTFEDAEIAIPFRFLRELLPPIENIEEFVNSNVNEEVLV